MEKQKLIREMQACSKSAGTISPRKIRLYTGYGDAKVADLLKGLDRLKDDNGEKFFISDVAERIMERTVRA